MTNEENNQKDSTEQKQTPLGSEENTANPSRMLGFWTRAQRARKQNIDETGLPDPKLGERPSR